MSEEKESELKIVDKRRFSSEGEANTEVDPAAEKARAEERRRAEEEASKKAAADSAGEQGPPEVDFPSFVMSLAAQALMMLGQVPNPETGQSVVNLEAARQTIDIIEMLAQKTRGNLSKEEEKLMAELLASLQMAYVNKVQEEQVKQP